MDYGSPKGLFKLHLKWQKRLQSANMYKVCRNFSKFQLLFFDKLFEISS